jgi:transposase
MRFRRCKANAGRPRCRPVCVVGDRGHDAAAIRHGLRVRHIVALLAMRRTTHGSGLGRWRWVIERTFAWLNQFRRLRVRYDKRADIHEAFLSLACVWICWQSLRARVRPRYRGAVRKNNMNCRIAERCHDSDRVADLYSNPPSCAARTIATTWLLFDAVHSA